MKAKRFPEVVHASTTWPTGWGNPGPYEVRHSFAESNRCGLCNHQLLLEGRELQKGGE